MTEQATVSDDHNQAAEPAAAILEAMPPDYDALAEPLTFDEIEEQAAEYLRQHPDARAESGQQ